MGVIRDKICTVAGCSGKHMAKGLCTAHYARMRNGTDMSKPVIRKVRSKAEIPCKASGCDRFTYTDYCMTHKARINRGISLDKPIRPFGRIGCTVAGCKRKHLAKGLCSFHYDRSTDGRPIDAPRKRNEPGIGTITEDGYRQFHRSGHPSANASGHLLEHRMIMAEMLGRTMFDHENVHHKNGARDDNRPENLELWSVSQPCGQRVDDKIAWMKEFLLQYGYVVTDPSIE